MNKGKRMRTFYVIAIVAMAAAFAVAFYLYNKPRVSVSNRDTAVTISAYELAESFALNEDTANHRFLGKVIEVRGKVVTTETDNNAKNNVLLEGNGTSLVACQLAESETSFSNIKAGQELIIKGICIGFLLDVSMKDCIIINEQSK